MINFFAGNLFDCNNYNGHTKILNVKRVRSQIPIWLSEGHACSSIAYILRRVKTFYIDVWMDWIGINNFMRSNHFYFIYSPVGGCTLQ